MTKMQAQLLSFLELWFSQTDVAPSYQEICKALNWKSKSTAFRVVSALEERGFIERKHYRARSIRLKSIYGKNPGKKLDRVIAAARALVDSVADESLDDGAITICPDALFALGMALSKLKRSKNIVL